MSGFFCTYSVGILALDVAATAYYIIDSIHISVKSFINTRKKLCNVQFIKIFTLLVKIIAFKSGVGKTCSLSETCSCSTESYGRDIRLNFFLLCRVSLGEARQGDCTQNFCQGWPRGGSQKSSCSSLISPL